MKILKTAVMAFALGVLGLGTSCAAQANWQLELWYSSSVAPDSSHITVGVDTSASDGYDALDLVGMNKVGLTARIYRSVADGWDGQEGFYRQDIRSPFTSGERTWDNVYLWSTYSTVYPEPVHLAPYDFMSDSDRRALSKLYKVTLFLDQIPAGVTYNGLYQWDMDWFRGVSAGYLPTIGSMTGFDAYKFHITVTAIPEPSGLAALTGCLGLGVLALRTRARRAWGTPHVSPRQ